MIGNRRFHSLWQKKLALSYFFFFLVVFLAAFFFGAAAAFFLVAFFFGAAFFLVATMRTSLQNVFRKPLRWVLQHEGGRESNRTKQNTGDRSPAPGSMPSRRLRSITSDERARHPVLGLSD